MHSCRCGILSFSVGIVNGGSIHDGCVGTMVVELMETTFL
jgi:hypothetical protein